MILKKLFSIKKKSLSKRFIFCGLVQIIILSCKDDIKSKNSPPLANGKENSPLPDFFNSHYKNLGFDNDQIGLLKKAFNKHDGEENRYYIDTRVVGALKDLPLEIFENILSYKENLIYMASDKQERNDSIVDSLITLKGIPLEKANVLGSCLFISGEKLRGFKELDVEQIKAFSESVKGVSKVSEENIIATKILNPRQISALGSTISELTIDQIMATEKLTPEQIEACGHYLKDIDPDAIRSLEVLTPEQIKAVINYHGALFGGEKLTKSHIENVYRPTTPEKIKEITVNTNVDRILSSLRNQLIV